MDLAIDIGNSFHKAALFSEKGEMVYYKCYKNITIDHIKEFFDFFPIENSILSSVGRDHAEIIKYLQSETHYIPFSHNSKLPISIVYDNLKTLGLDRIANAVAAYSNFAGYNILSIQAGSCLVFDFITKEGNYLGGSISPGIEMRFNALHHFTRRLPLLSKKEINYFIGHSTQQSIESGVINGVIHEINGFISNYKTNYKDLKILISGGDSDYLQNSIKNTIFVGSSFILCGLHKILKFNVENN
jgi:type III pantothenate kinase